jgi:hypothetical protein
MAAFCTNCGTQINEGAGFCANCGTPAQGPAQAAAARPATPPPPQASAPPPAPLAPRSGGSSFVKILLIVLAVIVGLGALGIVGSIYAIHKVKQKVVAVARENGVDVGDFSSSNSYRGRMPDPCSLLTASEASEIIGVTIERAERSGHQCEYFAHGVSDEEREAQVKKAMEDAQNKPDNAAGVEELTKRLVAGANTGGPYFTVELSENGRAQIAGMKLAMRAVAGAIKVTESVPGIGDEAIMGPMNSTMMFTKNGLGVQIDLRQIGRGREKAIALAERMLPRL